MISDVVHPIRGNISGEDDNQMNDYHELIQPLEFIGYICSSEIGAFYDYTKKAIVDKIHSLGQIGEMVIYTTTI
jgi:hypothetical protein